MANNRPVDITKKSNIKCEHCADYDSDWGVCKFHKARKYYYQRCKDFKWAERYLKGTDNETPD